MKIGDHLDYDTRRALNNLSKPKRNSKKKTNNEKLSSNDLKELMGMNRQTYKRGKGGAVRRK